MLFRSRKNVDMLNGPIVSRILQVAVPLMISNIIQALYSAADMMVVARSGVAGAVGAIGTTNTVINLVTNLFIGFSVGANVVVARNIGARDDKGVSEAVHTSVLAGFLFGLIGGIIGYLISQPAMVMMGDEGAILDMAVRYCKIRFIGLPLLGLTNFLVAIFRAKGNTTTSLGVLTVSGAINVAMNMIFVLWFGMDVDGVAWATVVSQLFSAVALFIYLRKEKDATRVSFRHLKINWAMTGEVLRVGIPAGIQAGLNNIGNMTVARSIIRMNNLLCPGGSAVLDGHSAAVSASHFALHCCNAVDVTLVSFTGQNVGAKNAERLKSVLRLGYLTVFAVSVATFGLLVLFRDPILSLYISDPEAMAIAYLRMWIVSALYPFGGALWGAGASFLRGMGRSTTSMSISLITNCVLRIVWVFTIFEYYQTMEALYISYPVLLFFGAAAQYIAVRIAYRKLTEKWKTQELSPAT
ncbi:MAG: MATE family efflux transporter [Oscillospiraceae bacterium]|nr:MATE family efflux transporter [Oscillospiraceae bacterium]